MSENSASKMIYMSYGGNKMYMGREGFLEDYYASEEEEAEWKSELIARQVETLISSRDFSDVGIAISTLEYHDYPGLKDLMLTKIINAAPKIKILLAKNLWTIFKYEKSFEILHSVFLEGSDENLIEIFSALISFKNNQASKQFVLECLCNSDQTIFKNAVMTIEMWGWTGMPELRAEDLLNKLKFENRSLPEFKEVVIRLKSILHLQ